MKYLLLSLLLAVSMVGYANDKANLWDSVIKAKNYLRNNDLTNRDVIGILLNRSIDLIISIIATIKVGATYVIIDNNLPQNRIDYIIDNSQAKYCLVNDNTSKLLTFDKAINIDKINILKYFIKRVLT